MEKRLGGMRFATLVECPAERTSMAPLGETGILEVYESERKHPGWAFALFSYTPGNSTDDYIAEYELSLPTLKYYRTAIHPMREEGGLVILDFKNGQRYAFEIINEQRNADG